MGHGGGSPPRGLGGWRHASAWTPARETGKSVLVIFSAWFRCRGSSFCRGTGALAGGWQLQTKLPRDGIAQHAGQDCHGVAHEGLALSPEPDLALVP